MAVMNDAKSSPDSGRRVRAAENSCVTNYGLQSIGKLPLSGIGSSLSIFCHQSDYANWLCGLGKEPPLEKRLLWPLLARFLFGETEIVVLSDDERRETYENDVKKSLTSRNQMMAQGERQMAMRIRLLLAFAPIFHSSTLLQMGS